MAIALLNAHRTPPANLFTAADREAVRRYVEQGPNVEPTPLHRYPALAERLGIGDLLIKDESARFGLNAFKGTGALFAVDTLLARGEVRRGDTLVCASEGNHGRAVAHAARRAGCHAIVYMSHSVSAARVQAIDGEGAEVRMIAGTYDDAVRTMAREAASHGWVIVSDTSWPGYSEIPRLIMLGYTRILDEIADKPDVVFVPAGVGGLLAAVACWCDLTYGVDRPLIVAVEPLSANCVQASIRAGQPTALSGPFTTTMGGLRCGEMSPVVYPVVASLVDAFVAIEDDFAFDAMRQLARPSPPDPSVPCGPSGAACMGGLLALLRQPDLSEVKHGLGLGPRSRVLGLVTEGVTDPVVFAAAVDRT